MQRILSWIDGPIISRFVAAIVGVITGVVAQHIVLSTEQLAQFKDALSQIVMLVVYAITHNGIKQVSSAAGNDIVLPAGSST